MRGTWKTDDDSGGRGALVVGVIAAVILASSGAVSAAVSALVTAVLIITGCTIGLAILGVVALIVHRARQDRPGRPIPPRAVYEVPREQPAVLKASRPRPAAIESPRELHLNLHLTITPEQLGRIIRNYTEGE